MKKLLAILISLCMVSAFAVPVFADANSDYIAAVKDYQACLLYTSPSPRD
mgnify:CR=1 FL=1